MKRRNRSEIMLPLIPKVKNKNLALFGATI